MTQRIIFTGQRQCALESVAPAPITDTAVRVKTLVSLVSTGTELICFNRNFAPGSHWDNWIKYPFTPGYSLIGQVTHVGAKVQQFRVGDRVAARLAHASEVVADAGDFFPVPAEMDSKMAAWFALAKIAGVGALAAQYVLGDSVLVIGAGPIGQMSVRWAKAAGATTIICVDTLGARLALAQAGGATAVVAGAINQMEAEILAANGGRRPRVVIDSTGHAAVFSAALAMAADRGRVVLLGDTGFPDQQHLTKDVIVRGLTVVGAHDGHVDVLTNAAGAGMFFKLAVSGQFNLAGLNTHTFRPDQCQQAYETIDAQREKTMGVLFDWTVI
jgi:2-desacetyl-2-hydroxyethyl bacteriochlorophyllide A dehydrogenase